MRPTAACVARPSAEMCGLTAQHLSSLCAGWEKFISTGPKPGSRLKQLASQACQHPHIHACRVSPFRPGFCQLSNMTHCQASRTAEEKWLAWRTGIQAAGHPARRGGWRSCGANSPVTDLGSWRRAEGAREGGRAGGKEREREAFEFAPNVDNV